MNAPNADRSRQKPITADLNAPYPGWQARLALRFSRTAAGVTGLSDRRHSGPLLVQRPFYPEGGGVCHAYLLHPPGGVVGGDKLAVDVEVEPGAHALLTAPAAAKLYRSNGPTAHLTQTLHVAPGATLEWLPPESIAFQGAQINACTRVDLRGDARFIGWEILCLGRPAANERFEHGLCRQSFEIWRDGAPVLLERGRYLGGSAQLRAPWGCGGMPVVGTLACAAEGTADLVENLRARIPATVSQELFGASQLDTVLVCRYLGKSAARAFQLFSHAWEIIRPTVVGIPPCAPRIWNT